MRMCVAGPPGRSPDAGCGIMALGHFLGRTLVRKQRPRMKWCKVKRRNSSAAEASGELSRPRAPVDTVGQPEGLLVTMEGKAEDGQGQRNGYFKCCWTERYTHTHACIHTL